MNTLLGDETYWNITERARAEQRFQNVVVRAFYEPMGSPDVVDPAAIREGELPFPGKDDGYSRILLVGTTGAGKTSLLRHLIGSHPKRDRFPSTSASRTTIADIEVITSPGDYRAVVTFFPRRLVRTYIAESVLEACRAAWRGESDERVVDALLTHREQRFRLAYVLGAWAPDRGEEAEDDDWGEEAEDPEAEPDTSSFPTSEDRNAMQRQLETYLESIRILADLAHAQLPQGLDKPLNELRGDEHEAAVATFLERIERLPGYSELTDSICNQALSRFDHLKEGLTKRSGWPEKWICTSSDRDAFVRQMRWFSSNHYKEYGRLLTPVVQGIRVKGPFVPDSVDEVPRLVLIDGEGLGHVPETAANVSTHYTSRYQSVDVILLVDNAKQPMQAAPLSVLRSVATSGYDEKLVIAFTHFDAVKGDALPGFRAKRDNVLQSVRSALGSLRDAIGDLVVTRLGTGIDERCFMLGWLDQQATGIPRGAQKELVRLLGFFEGAVKDKVPPEARPLYDPAGLAFAVQSAAGDFHSLWDARLGYRHRDGVSKEHWARVKALTRRVALRMDNYEYKHLMPVAELIGRLSEAVSRFLDAPAKWNTPARNDDEGAAAIARIRSEVHTALHSFAMERVIDQHLVEWARAYHYVGIGSTSERAQELRVIYGKAVPVPGIELSEVASAFLDGVRKLVLRAIRDGGGDLIVLG